MGLTRTPALTLTLTPTPTPTLYLTYTSPRGGLLYNVVDESTGEAPLTCDAVRDAVFNPGPTPTPNPYPCPCPCPCPYP